MVATAGAKVALRNSRRSLRQSVNNWPTELVRSQAPWSRLAISPSSSATRSRASLAQHRAAEAARVRVQGVLGTPALQACGVTPEDRPVTRVTMWNAPDGGVVLQEPLQARSWSAQLTFYAGRWNPESVLGSKIIERC